MKSIFDNPDKYKTTSDWEDSGLLGDLSIYHKNLLSNYFYKLLKMDSRLLNIELYPYYIPCLRRIFDEFMLKTDIRLSYLEEFNLDELQIHLNDFVDYINLNLPKTLIGLEHLTEELDYEAEACSIVCISYGFKLSRIYKDKNLLKSYLTKIKRSDGIGSIID